MSETRNRTVEFKSTEYQVISDEHATCVWDADDCIAAVDGSDWTDEQIRGLIKTYRSGFRDGTNSGRIALRDEIRRLLEVAPAA